MAQRLEDCLRTATQAVREHDMDPQERQRIIDGLERVLDDTEISPEQKRARLVAMGREYRKQAYIARVSKVIDEDTRANLLQDISERPPEEQGEIFRSWVEQDASYGPLRDGASLSMLVHQEETQALGKITPILKDLGDRRVPWIQDTPFARTFMQELHGIDTGNPTAKQHVETLRETVGPYLDRLRQAGFWVNRMDDYAWQNHSASKIIADKDNWIEFFARNLDPEEHPDPRATAEHVYNTLVTRDLQDPQGATLSMGRKVKFKDADAAFQYQMTYGQDSVQHALIDHVRTLARQTILVENFGPTPQRNIEHVTSQLSKRARQNASNARSRGDKRKTKKYEKQERQIHRAESIAASITGELATPANLDLANWMGAARQYTNAQVLGQVSLLMTTQDSAISVYGSRFHTGGFASSTNETLQALTEVMTREDVQAWAEENGVWMHAAVQAAVNRWATPFDRSEHMRGLAGQAATTTQRVTGNFYLESALRSATLLVQSRAMMRHAQYGWDQLDARYRKVLEANGLNRQRWEEFRARARPKDDLGAVDTQALPRELRERVLAFLYRENNLAVVYPNHYDRVALTFGARPGTGAGEGAAMATHLWSWSIAMMRGPLRRELAMGGSGFAGFAGGMVAAGLLSTQLYAMARGEPTYEWDSPDLWIRGVARSGALTPVGELALNSLQYGGLDVGPIPQMGTQTLQSIGHGAMAAIDGDSSRFARSMLQNVGEDWIVPNWWWLNYGVTSRVMDAAMWEIDPQYMQDRERRWIQEGRNL